MDKLPNPILHEILSCLTPREILLAFLPLNKSTHALVYKTNSLSHYLNHILRINKPYTFSVCLALRILRSLASGAKTRGHLRFIGFATTGGMENDVLTHWVDHLYNWKSIYIYNSRKPARNINTAGVLQSTQSKSKILEELEAMLNNFDQCLWNCSLLSRYCDPSEIKLRRQKLKLQIQKSQLSNEIKDKLMAKIDNDIEKLLENILEAIKLRRRPKDPFVLIDPIDHTSGEVFFIANEIHLRWDKSFKCNLEAFMVFISEEYVDVESDEFKKYDDVITIHDFEAFLHKPFGQQFVVSDFFQSRGAYYRKFAPSSRNLKPVVWCYLQLSLWDLKIILDQYFYGVYLYTKLISGERNKVRNINIGHMRLKGFEFSSE